MIFTINCNSSGDLSIYLGVQSLELYTISMIALLELVMLVNWHICRNKMLMENQKIKDCCYLFGNSVDPFLNQGLFYVEGREDGVGNQWEMGFRKNPGGMVGNPGNYL